jgi:hypothetical protein
MRWDVGLHRLRGSLKCRTSTGPLASSIIIPDIGGVVLRGGLHPIDSSVHSRRFSHRFLKTVILSPSSRRFSILLGLGLFFTWLRLFAPFLRLFQFFLGMLDDPADLFKTQNLACLEPFKDCC